ncbi:MAG: hypothetical protein ACI83D_000441 [Planctomycetota bacterium]|jgi:hypothetical protein
MVLNLLSISTAYSLIIIIAIIAILIISWSIKLARKQKDQKGQGLDKSGNVLLDEYEDAIGG